MMKMNMTLEVKTGKGAKNQNHLPMILLTTMLLKIMLLTMILLIVRMKIANRKKLSVKEREKIMLK